MPNKKELVQATLENYVEAIHAKDYVEARAIAKQLKLVLLLTND